MKETFDNVMIAFSLFVMLFLPFLPLLIWALLDKYGFLDEEESET